MKSDQKDKGAFNIVFHDNSSVSKIEEERLRAAMHMSDMEKFRLFTQMLRANALYKRVMVTHKK